MTEEKKGIEEYESCEEYIPKIRMWVRATKKVQVKDFEPQEYGAGIEEIFDKQLSRQEKSDWQSNNFRICNENIDKQFRIASEKSKRARDMDLICSPPISLRLPTQPIPSAPPKPKPDSFNVQKELTMLLRRHQLPIRVWQAFKDLQNSEGVERLEDIPENALMAFWDKHDLGNLKKEKDE